MIRTVALLALLVAGCAPRQSGDWPVMAELHQGLIPESTATRDRTIRVVTYNLQGCREIEKLREDLAALDGDILLLQELRLPASATDAAARRQAVVPLLPPPQAQWHLATAAVNPIDRSSGDAEAQVIASRYPLNRAEISPLAPESRRRRYALAATISVGGREILVVNTDHEPGYFGLVPTQDRHLARLAETLDARNDPIVIVGGDFNTCGNLWRLRTTTADARRASHVMRTIGFEPGVATAYHSFGRWPMQMCLDHLFVRGAGVIEGSTSESARGSDHRPVWARVQLNDTK
jgi:endonuclease/exonuclease/phosphatase (EEP) superfamily protein YafD